eukprot:4071174-Prymnesium_polylepis.1
MWRWTRPSWSRSGVRAVFDTVLSTAAASSVEALTRHVGRAPTRQLARSKAGIGKVTSILSEPSAEGLRKLESGMWPPCRSLCKAWRSVWSPWTALVPLKLAGGRSNDVALTTIAISTGYLFSACSRTWLTSVASRFAVALPSNSQAARGREKRAPWAVPATGWRRCRLPVAGGVLRTVNSISLETTSPASLHASLAVHRSRGSRSSNLPSSSRTAGDLLASSGLCGRSESVARGVANGLAAKTSW